MSLSMLTQLHLLTVYMNRQFRYVRVKYQMSIGCWPASIFTVWCSLCCLFTSILTKHCHSKKCHFLTSMITSFAYKFRTYACWLHHCLNASNKPTRCTSLAGKSQKARLSNDIRWKGENTLFCATISGDTIFATISPVFARRRIWSEMKQNEQCVFKMWVVYTLSGGGDGDDPHFKSLMIWGLRPCIRKSFCIPKWNAAHIESDLLTFIQMRFYCMIT
jgi:hypothetical protein